MKLYTTIYKAISSWKLELQLENKVFVQADTSLVKQVLRKGDWNDYEVRSENGRIQIKLNGKLTVDYTEPDKTIPQTGRIALQIHGGGKAEVSFKEIRLTSLP